MKHKIYILSLTLLVQHAAMCGSGKPVTSPAHYTEDIASYKDNLNTIDSAITSVDNAIDNKDADEIQKSFDAADRAMDEAIQKLDSLSGEYASLNRMGAKIKAPIDAAIVSATGKAFSLWLPEQRNALSDARNALNTSKNYARKEQFTEAENAIAEMKKRYAEKLGRRQAAMAQKLGRQQAAMAQMGEELESTKEEVETKRQENQRLFAQYQDLNRMSQNALNNRTTDINQLRSVIQRQQEEVTSLINMVKGSQTREEQSEKRYDALQQRYNELLQYTKSVNK